MLVAQLLANRMVPVDSLVQQLYHAIFVVQAHAFVRSHGPFVDDIERVRTMINHITINIRLVTSRFM